MSPCGSRTHRLYFFFSFIQYPYTDKHLSLTLSLSISVYISRSLSLSLCLSLCLSLSLSLSLSPLRESSFLARSEQCARIYPPLAPSSSKLSTQHISLGNGTSVMEHMPCLSVTLCVAVSPCRCVCVAVSPCLSVCVSVCSCLGVSVSRCLRLSVCFSTFLYISPAVPHWGYLSVSLSFFLLSSNAIYHTS